MSISYEECPQFTFPLSVLMGPPITNLCWTVMSAMFVISPLVAIISILRSLCWHTLLLMQEHCHVNVILAVYIIIRMNLGSVPHTYRDC